MIFFALMIQEHDGQNCQIPDTLIQKSRMHLNKIDISHERHAVKLRLCDICGAHCINGQSHGKQRVRVPAKDFPVKEIPPAPDNLS